LPVIPQLIIPIKSNFI